MFLQQKTINILKPFNHKTKGLFETLATANDVVFAVRRETSKKTDRYYNKSRAKHWITIKQGEKGPWYFSVFFLPPVVRQLGKSARARALIDQR